MKLWRYLTQYGFPGLILFFLAFWSGAHAEVIWSFIGFLSFFTAAVFLWVEGKNKIWGRSGKDDSSI